MAAQGLAIVLNPNRGGKANQGPHKPSGRRTLPDAHSFIVPYVSSVLARRQANCLLFAVTEMREIAQVLSPHKWEEPLPKGDRAASVAEIPRQRGRV